MTQPGGGEPLRKITLTDNDGTSFDLILKGGDKSILETFLSPDPKTPGGVGKYGDFEPGFGFIEQRDLSRGFGSEELTSDPSMYYGGNGLWTATPNKWFPQIEWKFAEGFQQAHGNYSTDKMRIVGGNAYHTYIRATPFTATFTGISNKVTILVGTGWQWTDTPGIEKCRLAIWEDDSGKPDIASGPIAYTANLMEDADSSDARIMMKTYTLSAAFASSSGNTYWCGWDVSTQTGPDPSIVGSLTDLNSYSYVGGYPDGIESTTEPDMWFRIFPTISSRRLIPFISNNVLFAIAKYDDATAPKLYINGDTGKATAGASTTLTDSNTGLRTSWSNDQWNGASLWIINGTGAGQIRTISDSTSAGVLTVSTAWKINPSTDSEYVIVDTDDWEELTGHGIGATFTGSVASTNKVMYFAMGGSTNIRRARVNYGASPPAMQYADDGTNKSDVLGVSGSHVYSGLNSDTGKARRSGIQDWGDDLSLSNLGNTGEHSKFTKIVAHGSSTFFFKTDSVWVVNDGSSSIVEYPVSVGAMPSEYNGQAAVSHEEYLFFNWLYSLERLSGLTVDNIDPNRDAGMRNFMQGPISSMVAHPAGVLFSVDAGANGTSGVYIFDGLGFHEACRPFFEGDYRIRDILWQPIPDRQPILWIGCGDDMIYQKYPKYTTNPTKDPDVRYTYYMELVTPTIDMGAKGMKKMFRDVTLVAESFPDGIVALYYDALDGNGWNYLGDVTDDDETLNFSDTAFYTGLQTLGNVREVRLRFVATEFPVDEPISFKAYTLKGFGRTPTKKQWSIPVDVSKTMELLGTGDPETFMDWVDTKAENADPILMTSEHVRMHNKNVIIIPRSLRTFWIDSTNESFAAVAYLELREA